LRKLVVLISLVALVWSAWWGVAALGLQSGLEHWFDMRRDRGWQADAARINVDGYPLSLHARLSDVALADPASGLALQAPFLDLDAPAYWPGYVTLKLPAEPLYLASPEGRTKINTTRATADLRLHPGTALELETLAAQSGPWSLETSQGSLLSAGDLQIAARQEAAAPETYQLTIEADALTPGPLLRQSLRLRDSWPVSFDTFAGDLTVTFDRPWDRSALEERRPQPRELRLHRAEAIWGAVALMATGNLSIDAEGIPTGLLTLKVENWEALLNMAQAAGYLPESLRPQAEAMLRALAKMSGRTDGLDLDLNLSNGTMALGFVNLGPAPRILLR
jgi:hypothetical protein